MTIPLPQGYRLNGVHCGIKQQSQQEDVTLIVSDSAATAAGVYTQNVIRAAPVELDASRTPANNIRAIIVNSGNANACTGTQGDQDAIRMTQMVAEVCHIPAESVLVMSTGIIGTLLPMDCVQTGIQAAAQDLASSLQHWEAAARGIMTTDLVPKMSGRLVDMELGPVHITGIAKGSGMIGPNMATMLSVLLTDAPLDADTAQSILTEAVQDSFHCISVDGHTSTNDTVLLLANGHNRPGTLTAKDEVSLRQAVKEVCIDLARAIAADGEGASHLITIDVAGSTSCADAHKIARAVANSPLVKTAIAGADPNWGRIVSAAGYAGVPFDPTGLDLAINGTMIYQAGTPLDFDAEQLSALIRDTFETSIVITLHAGNAGARFWTCDLTNEYVHINADYHT